MFIETQGADPIVAGITDKPAPSSRKLTTATQTRHKIHLQSSLQIHYPSPNEVISYVFVETSALSAAPGKTPAVGDAGLPIANADATTGDYAAGCGVGAAATVQGSWMRPGRAAGCAAGAGAAFWVVWPADSEPGPSGVSTALYAVSAESMPTAVGCGARFPNGANRIVTTPAKLGVASAPMARSASVLACANCSVCAAVPVQPIAPEDQRLPLEPPHHHALRPRRPTRADWGW